MKRIEDIDTGLKPQVIAAIRGVLLEYPEIESAILYGSRATGQWRRASDIDLTLTGKSLTYARLCEIDYELDELLLPWKIDLSILHQIKNPELVRRIEFDGVLLYEAHTKDETVTPSVSGNTS